LIVTSPLSAIAEVMVNTSSSASVSLASTSIVTGVSSFVVAVSLVATGASLTAFTSTLMLAGSESSSPSVTT